MWNQIRLDEITSLSVTTADGGDDTPDSDFDNGNMAVAEAITKFFHKQPLGLTSFKIDHQVVFPMMVFPSFTDAGLRKLRSVHLVGVQVDVQLFAQDISRMPDLKSLLFRQCWPAPHGHNWRLVFEAIHFHAKPMSFNFNECWGDDSTDDWTIQLPVLDPAKCDEYAALIDHESDRCLYRYLANCGSWTSELQDLYG